MPIWTTSSRTCSRCARRRRLRRVAPMTTNLRHPEGKQPQSPQRTQRKDFSTDGSDDQAAATRSANRNYRERKMISAISAISAVAFLCLAVSLSAQVTPDRLANASSEPQQWMMYSGAYDGSRFSPLDQINKTNVQRLSLQWVFQTGVRGRHETTPLVIDGVMYLTTPQNHAFAVDVRSGRPLWHYQRTLPKDMSLCCGPQNRGVAALGDRVFMGTLDAHVVALDARTGRVRWDT